MHVSRPARFLAPLLASAALLASASVSAEPLEPVLSLAKKEKPAVVETIRSLVSIESGSQDKAGLDRIADLIGSRLTALGAKVEFLTPSPADVPRMEDTPKELAKVVVGRFTGKGKRRIMILAHMDTVFPHGTLAKRPFRIEGNRAYGPGVLDDKSGVAAALHAVAVLREMKFDDFGVLTVLISGDEEVSSPGGRAIIGRIADEHDFVFSCETTPWPRDVVTTATSGIGAAVLTVHGRASHAGSAPEKGRNALVELAHQIMQMRDLSDPKTGVKFNWTLAKAGETRNVIPELATATADVRISRVSDYDGIERAFRERAKNKLIEDTKVEPTFERRRPPLEPTEKSRRVVARAQAVYAELGRKLEHDDSGKGGGTDAAFAALSGKAVVVERFGFGGTGSHSENEYLDLDSIEPRLYLLTRLVMEVSRPDFVVQNVPSPTR